MARFCKQCARPRLDLADPVVLEKARKVTDMLQQLRGYVEEQKQLLIPLREKHGMSHGTGQHYVDALHTWGFLKVGYHGHRPRRKWIKFVRRPEVPNVVPRPVDDPEWPNTRSPLEDRGLL